MSIYISYIYYTMYISIHYHIYSNPGNFYFFIQVVYIHTFIFFKQSQYLNEGRENIIQGISSSEFSLQFLSIRNDNHESTIEDTLFAKITDMFFLCNSQDFSGGSDGNVSAYSYPLIGHHNAKKIVMYVIIISNYP